MLENEVAGVKVVALTSGTSERDGVVDLLLLLSVVAEQDVVDKAGLGSRCML